MRKYVIGMVAALVGALALSSVASADVTGVSIVSNITPATLQQVEPVRIARKGELECVVGVIASTVPIN